MAYILKHGKIYDGTGAEPFKGDILIEDDRITQMGEDLHREGAEIVDLHGLSVSSGFFDAHSHNDWFAIKRQPKTYFEPFIRQGITSFIAGNCGLSSMGFDADSPYVDKVGAGLFGFRDVTGAYGTVDGFFNAIDRNTPCNIATLIGHCSARTGVAGYENRPLSAEEMQKMLKILEQGLQEGACGISLGLMYEPGLYAPAEELKAVARLCERYDRPMTVHPRACSAVSMSYPQLLGRPHLLRALDELVEIAEGTHMKLHYSHAIFVGRKSFKCKDELIDILHRLRQAGVDAQFDIYSEMLGVSVITVIMPAWYQALSREEKRKPLNYLKFKLLATVSCKLLGFSFDDIQIAYVGRGNERFEGKTVHQIARELGKGDLDTYLDLCEMSNFKGRVNMGPYSTPEIVSALSKDEHALYMTDAWVEDYGVQNPAIYDCFPKFLQNSLLGSGDTMARTVRKMTGAVADRFSIEERGYVKPGNFADLTVFDEAALKNGVPDQGHSFGIERVFINGAPVLVGQNLDDTALRTTGRAMRCRL